VQNKAAKFANHTNNSVWEILAQRSKVAGICALFKAYTGERAWKVLQGTGYRDHATSAGMITIVKLGPGNKELISVNTPL